MAAIFRRKLTTATAVLGAGIKDSPVSVLYKDVFDGNSDIFAEAEGLNTGELPMGNYSRSVDYLIEFPMLNTPSFGEATLSGLELNLYFSDLNYKRDYFSNTLKVFKLKEEIGTNADGFFGSLQTADLFFASAIPNKVLLDMEDFSAPGLGTNPTVVPVGALFVNAEIAYSQLKWNNVTEYMLSDKEEFFEKYAEKYMNEDVVYLEYYSAPWNYRTYTEPVWNAIERLGNFLTGFDVDREKHSYQLLRPVNRRWLGFDPTWYTSEFKGHLRTTGGYMEIPADMSMSENERLGLASTDNTFFDEVRYSPAHKLAFLESNVFAVAAYSYPQVDADGLHMTARWSQSLSAADGSPLTFGSTSAPYQSVMLRKSLPHPSWLIREKGSSSTHKEGLEIDITFKINELPVMERITDVDNIVQGNTAGKSDGITLATRGFFITLGTNAPTQNEDFTQYIGNAYEADSSNPKVSGTHTNVNNNWVFGIISYAGWEDYAGPTGTNSGVGTICIVTGGGATNNKNYIAAMNSDANTWEGSAGGERGTSTDGVPYFYTLGAGHYSTLHSLSGNGSYQRLATFGFGDWVKLKIVISNEYPRVGYILTDSEDNIIWSRKDLRMGRASGTLEENCKGDGFPRHMCLWLNNRKIHFDATEATEGYYKTSKHDAIASVSVQSIDISNVTCEVFNGTHAIHNEGFKRTPEINSETDRSLIQADDLNSSVTSGTDAHNFGETAFPGTNIYEAFGLESGTVMGVVPSYLIFGTTTKEDWEDQNTNLFLGGYSTANSTESDSGDTRKRMSVNSPSQISYSDVIMYAPDTSPDLGNWTGNIYTDNINKATAGFRMRDNTNAALMEVQYFTRKGFVRFQGGSLHNSSDEDDAWTKRECPFLAAKIIKINNNRTGKVTVADMSGLLGKQDEEYIIYRIGKSWDADDTYYKTGLKLANNWDGTATLRFNADLRKGDDGTTSLCREKYLDELYISPYRFWLIMEMYNIARGDDTKVLPSFNYGHTLLLDDVTSPDSTPKGLTYSELLYSDAPYNQNAWSLTVSKNSSIETEKDYGFGTLEKGGEGYLAKEKISKESDYTLFDVSGIVEEIDKNRKDDKITFYITKDVTSKGSSKLSSTRTLSSLTKPYLTFVYTDALPSVEDFKVQPNEDDPFYAQYTWSSNNDDLWYGFMILDETAIKHQYHSAVAHMPLSEKDIETDGSKTYLYRYNDLYNGAAVAGNGTTVLNTIEGLSGYALDFSESGSLAHNVYWDDGDYTDPTSHASFVAHVVVSSTTANHYIVSKREQFEIYIDSGGKVNAKLYYSSSASVNLQSFSVAPEDGETPINIIMTLDVSLAVGNCKLFINGKLEDQSGEKTTDGSTHNWKINTNLSKTASQKLIIGMQNASGSTYTNRFNGFIEEVVVYNKTIYPVVPQTGELTIYKQPEELTVADIAAGKTIVAKLFIKDYHNIRGTTTNEVASTSMVAYRKSGVGIKTN